MTRLLTLFITLAAVSGCSMHSHTNVRGRTTDPVALKASFLIQQPRGRSRKTLMVLALSGGGSRAAYWSGEVMPALERVFAPEWNLLHEVDAISSVSGGSLPAAYYAVSVDGDSAGGREQGAMGRMLQLGERRRWDRETVRRLMGRNYRRRWVWSWFLPTNIARFWFTAYDRSDIMAQTFADNLFDSPVIGTDLRFRDLNPERPNLIINATNGTADHFGQPFTFTAEDFRPLNSDLAQYKIARAVMASAAFPGAFNYMTLKDYSQPNHYYHVFDGGNFDNLGLISAMRVIEANRTLFSRVVVILIDAYVPGGGVPHDQVDGRSALDFGVDLNFLDSFDALLAVNRIRIIHEFADTLGRRYPGKSVFYHICFDQIRDEALKRRLHSIKTDFRIGNEATGAIQTAAARLITPENPCLQRIRHLLETGTDTAPDPYCGCKPPKLQPFFRSATTGPTQPHP